MALISCVVVLTVCACATAIVGPAGNGTKTVHKTDTYLDAYSKSRIDAEKAKAGVIIVTPNDAEKKTPVDKKITNREDTYQPSYDYSPSYPSSDSYSASGYSAPSANSYLPPSYNPVKFETPTYTAPANSYGPPAPTYGPPAKSYGPPAHSYGPPAHSYGPPVHKPYPPAPVYGPPVSHGVPYSTGLGFLDKLKLKLDLLTIAKLLLKLLIFKKLVTMLAVVCMLLVIPKIIEFKKGGEKPSHDEEGYERKFGENREIKLQSAHQLLQRAISVYGQNQPDCGLTCRVQRVIDDIYEFQPYFRFDGAEDAES
ncbi:adhesive plaque matrix protein [Plutella xylostella]|uniref:adhesive plaque matrix protein n=1 Tax=Plutella xylostella TaxID=51655 RepID=UPI0020329861|nr:adhesive plaque matrix protein [Plutella xylostella]